MKFSEFRRWLKAQGVVFEAGKGSHFKVTAPNGNKTTFADPVSYTHLTLPTIYSV